MYTKTSDILEIEDWITYENSSHGKTEGRPSPASLMIQASKIIIMPFISRKNQSRTHYLLKLQNKEQNMNKLFSSLNLVKLL